jgi:hypothetical protein
MVDLAIGWLLAQPGVSCLLVCELQLLLLRLLLLLRRLLRLRLLLRRLLRLLRLSPFVVRAKLLQRCEERAGRRAERAAAGVAHAVHNLQQNGLCFDFSLCLSRACIGKLIIFI